MGLCWALLRPRWGHRKLRSSNNNNNNTPHNKHHISHKQKHHTYCYKGKLLQQIAFKGSRMHENIQKRKVRRTPATPDVAKIHKNSSKTRCVHKNVWKIKVGRIGAAPYRRIGLGLRSFTTDLMTFVRTVWVAHWVVMSCMASCRDWHHHSALAWAI